jgi:hypothetical protein
MLREQPHNGHHANGWQIEENQRDVLLASPL